MLPQAAETLSWTRSGRKLPEGPYPLCKWGSNAALNVGGVNIAASFLDARKGLYTDTAILFRSRVGAKRLA